VHSFEALSVPPGAIGIHWFGQNSFALKDAAGTIVQIDPFFPHKRPPEVYIHVQPPLDEADLRTDHVLVTHDHSDHTCVESLLRIHAAFPWTRFVGPVESVERMAEHGIPRDLLTVIEAGGSAGLGTMRVLAFWSKPPGGVPAEGIKPPRVQHLGYVIDASGLRVYVSGDLINTFAEHDELVAPIAALRPDVGLLTMHPTEGEFPYFEGAVDMAVKLGLKAVVPAHYACFVKRTYDSQAWAALLPQDGPRPLVIPYNSAVVHSQAAP
jgi:L-ascorbate metabolism protein UlaG (beta-lactamase superfamily)